VLTDSGKSACLWHDALCRDILALACCRLVSSPPPCRPMVRVGLSGWISWHFLDKVFKLSFNTKFMHTANSPFIAIYSAPYLYMFAACRYKKSMSA
jgi:hypothetical protein